MRRMLPFPLAGYAAAAFIGCAAPSPTPMPSASPPAVEPSQPAEPKPAEPKPAEPKAAETKAIEVAPAVTLTEEERGRYELAAAYSADHGGRSLLILKADEVVFEAGQNGHSTDTPMPLHSASESFWGLLAVAADADGMLDLDEPVAFTLPEFAADPRKSEIRIRQLLNFTSGLAPGVRALARDRTPDLYAQALELEMIASPGDRFQYGPGQLYVFAELLKRKLAGQDDDPVGYLEKRILDPIGLEVAKWDRDDAGNTDIALGAWLAPREWAKLGTLLKNRGTWQGREIVAADAIALVFEGSDASDEYGLTLWLNGGATSGSTFYPDGLPDLSLAAGLGNQRLYIIPSLDLVVARFADRDRHWRDREFLARLVDGAAD